MLAMFVDFSQVRMLVLWIYLTWWSGAKGFVHRSYDVLKVWRERARFVEGKALDSGHFLPEEIPLEVYKELIQFYGDE